MNRPASVTSLRLLARNSLFASTALGLLLPALAGAQALDEAFLDDDFPVLEELDGAVGFSDPSLGEIQDIQGVPGGFPPDGFPPGGFPPDGFPSEAMMADQMSGQAMNAGSPNDMMSMSMSSSASRPRGASAADQAAFAEVYDLLAGQYLQAQSTGMLFNNADAVFVPQQQAVEPEFVQEPEFQDLPQDPSPLPLPLPDDNPLDGLDDLAELPDLGDADFGDGDLGPENTSGFYIGGYVGANFPQAGELTDIATDTKQSDLTGAISVLGGGLAGYKFGDFRLEAEGQYAQSKFTLDNDPVLPDGTEGTSVRLAGFANGLYGLNLFGSFNALLGGSVGYGQQTDTIDGTEYTAQGLMYGPMVGLSYALTNNLEIGLRYRYLLGDAFTFRNENDTEIYSRPITEHQGAITATIRF